MKSLWLKLCPFLFCWVLFLSGCASNAGLNGVNITLTDLRPSGEAQAAMSLNFVNENVIPIAVSGGAYTLFLNGTSVGKTMSNDAVGLPQQSTANLKVTIPLENAGRIKKLLEANQSKTASYRLESVLRIDAGEERLTLKTSSAGSVDVSAFH